jgi:hypothetical protein
MELKDDMWIVRASERIGQENPLLGAAIADAIKMGNEQKALGMIGIYDILNLQVQNNAKLLGIGNN